MKKFYTLLTAALASLAVSAAPVPSNVPQNVAARAAQSQTLNANGYTWEGDSYTGSWSNEFSFTLDATVEDGVVTFPNIFGSTQSLEITAYTDGTARVTGTDEYAYGTLKCGNLSFECVYLTSKYLTVSYDTEKNRLWITMYPYYDLNTATNSYNSYYELGFYVNLPSDYQAATPTDFALFGSGNFKIAIGSYEGLNEGTLTEDGLLTLKNFLGGSTDLVFQITTAADGSKTVHSVSPAQGYYEVNMTVGGVAYEQMYYYGDYYVSYKVDGKNEYISYPYFYLGNYVELKVYMPREASDLRDELIGEYKGNAAGYDYSGTKYSGEYFTTKYDGTENAYVKFEKGEKDNEVKISNLIPTGNPTVHATEVLTGVVAPYVGTKGYKATITIDPVDDGYVDYIYSGTPYEVNTRFAAAWNNDAWEKLPTAPVVLYVTEDGEVKLTWTGILLWMDWNGNQSAWYSGYILGYDGDTLTNVNAAGVNTITVDADNSDAPVEYFNLNGVRLNGDNLTPGLYIRRQGTKATKVIVR